MCGCHAKPAGADTYFGTREQFEAAHRRSARAALRAYLETLGPEVAAAVRQSMVGLLSDILGEEEGGGGGGGGGGG